MRILTEGFVTHFKGRLINIHPSLLPKYQGLNTHQRAIDAGDSEAGASVHFVTEELDGGPVIAQAKVPVESNDTAEALAKRVLTVEHGIFPVVIGWFADKRIQLDNNQVLFDQKRLLSPIQWPLVN
jgi:phosphoribosylglycinamide formyltransferase-1